MYQCQYMNVLTVSNPYTDTEFLTQEVSHVWSVAEIIKGLVPPVTTTIKKQNVRKDLLNELYSLYLEACNKEYSIKNKKRYYVFIRLHHPAALAKKEEYNKYKDVFRKAKLNDNQKYLKPIKSDDFVWWGRFSHLKGEDGNECLRTIISNATEMKAFNKPVIQYILGASGKLSVDK